MQERDADLRRNRTGAGAPRDDRAWPPWAAAFSVVASTACVLGVGLLVAARDDRSEALIAAVTAVAAAVLAGWAVWVSSQAMIDGRSGPGLATGVLVALFIGSFVAWAIRPLVGACALLGVLAGVFAANLAAQRSARRNRTVVEELQREEAEVDRAYTDRRAEQERRHPPTDDARLGQLLRGRRAQERRHLLAWLVAATPLLLVGAVIDAPVLYFWVVGGFAAGAVLWVGRRLMGAWLAERDFRRAQTPPRRAFVVLLSDPAPKMVRPLLAVWADRPVSGDGAFPKADHVYRADEEVDELLSRQGSVELHEAWVDTGPRSWSKPRWVVANDGIALPHRRAVLGRLYVYLLLRAERPDRPAALSVREPHPSQDIDQSAPRLPGFGKAVAWRLALLGIGGVALGWLS